MTKSVKSGIIRGDEALEILKRGIEVHGKVLQLLQLEDLTIDNGYQRPIVPSSVSRIVGNFDPKAVGVFQVGRRKSNKRNYTIDGNNRRTAMLQLKEEKLLPPQFSHGVVCLVEEDTTVASESRQFVVLNTNRPVTGNNRFRANLKHRGQPEFNIDKWVKSEGFVLDFLSQGRATEANSNPNGIRSVAILVRCYNHCREYMVPALKFLRLLYKKSSHVPYGLRNGPVVYGLALFLKDQGCKDVGPIVNTVKSRQLDLSAAWDDIKASPSDECFQHDFSRLLKEWLEDNCGNGTIRRKRAA